MATSAKASKSKSAPVVPDSGVHRIADAERSQTALLAYTAYIREDVAKMLRAVHALRGVADMSAVATRAAKDAEEAYLAVAETLSCIDFLAEDMTPEQPAGEEVAS